jgi:hypothetical protein
MVIIEGPKAGGHLGFSEEELSYYTDEKYAHEIGNIQKTVDSYAKKYDTELQAAGVRPIIKITKHEGGCSCDRDEDERNLRKRKNRQK